MERSAFPQAHRVHQDEPVQVLEHMHKALTELRKAADLAEDPPVVRRLTLEHAAGYVEMAGRIGKQLMRLRSIPHPGREHVFDDPVYECGGCGEEFERSGSADGDGNRCPECGRFGSATETVRCQIDWADLDGREHVCGMDAPRWSGRSGRAAGQWP